MTFAKRLALLIAALACGAALAQPALADRDGGQRGGGHYGGGGNYGGGHHGGGHHGGGHNNGHWSGSVVIGLPFYGGYYGGYGGYYGDYPYGYGYGYPGYGERVVVIREVPRYRYTQRYGEEEPRYGGQTTQIAPAQENWYYCDSARAYYPDVSTCAEGWREVAAKPADAP